MCDTYVFVCSVVSLAELSFNAFHSISREFIEFKCLNFGDEQDKDEQKPTATTITTYMCEQSLDHA